MSTRVCSCRPISASQVTTRHVHRLCQGRRRLNVLATLNPPVNKLEFELRDATTKDMQFIQRAVRKAWMNPLGLDQARFIVAENDERKMLGFGQLELKSEEPKRLWELRSLFVLPKHRNKGVARAIIDALMQRAGDDEVVLTTVGQTTGLYRQAGFEEVTFAAMPGALKAEWIVGTVVAFLAVQDRLTVMRRPARDKKL